MTDVIFSILCLAGLVFIAQPSFIFGFSQYSSQEANRVLGVRLACFSALFMALMSVTVRKMGMRVHFSISVFYFACVGIFESLITMLVKSSYTLPCHHDLFIMGLIGLASLIYVTLMTLALQKGPAGPVCIAQTFQVIFAFFLEYIFLGAVPSLYSVLGAATVVTSSMCLIIMYRRRMMQSMRKGSQE